MATIPMNFKVEESKKRRFDEIARNIGATPSGLLNIFITRVVNDGGVPFKLEESQVHPDYADLPESTKTEMIRVLAIEAGLIEDDYEPVTDMAAYRKEMLES